MKKNYVFLINMAIAMLLMFNPILSKGQVLLNEEFDYGVSAANLTLVGTGWAPHSGAGTNSVKYITSSLSFPGYVMSVGGAITLATSGEDVNKQISPSISTAGVNYVAMLVNVASAQSGDYFFSFGATSGTSAISDLKGKLFARTTTGGFNFGVSKAANTAATNYYSAVYNFNTTYLVVIKYTIVSGSANDIADLFILDSSIPAVEPTVTFTAPDPTGADIASISSICVRQGSAVQTAVVTIDGIRVAHSWNDAVGVPLPAASIIGFSFAPQAGLTGSSAGTTISGNNISVLLPSGSTATSLTPTITLSRNVTIEPSTTIGQDFSVPVQYTIDGINVYTVNVSVAATLSSANSITGFDIAGQAGTTTILGNSIYLNFPFGADISALTVSGVISSAASVSPDFSVPQNFNSPVFYTVTAQDGSDNVYTVTSTLLPGSSAKDVLTYSFAEYANSLYAGVISGTDISILLPYQTDLTSLTPVFTSSAFATVSGLASLPGDFSSVKTLTVTAQDMSTKVYSISVVTTSIKPISYIIAEGADLIPTVTGTLTIKGQIVGGNVAANTGLSGGYQGSLIDDTGAITIRIPKNIFTIPGLNIAEGKLITVTGYYDDIASPPGRNYNGLKQFTVAKVNAISTTTNARLTPHLVTVLDETTEAQLVKVVAIVDSATWNNTSGQGYNVSITVGGMGYIMRTYQSTELFGTKFTTLFGPKSRYKEITITGLGGQYDPSAPYNGGYQLVPYLISDFETYVESQGNAIISFSYLPQAGLNTTVTGVISGTNISVTLPYGVTVAGLVPTITISAKATSNPALGVAPDYISVSGQYFANYLITSEAGNTKGYLLTVSIDDAPTATLDAVSKTVKIYPNPASSVAYIESAYSGVVEIYSLLGVKVAETAVIAGTSAVSVASLPKGVYIVKLSAGGAIVTKQLIVE